MTHSANDDNIKMLLDRLKNGDEQAAVAIYRSFYGCVNSFVGLYVDDSAAAEEIVHDTFLAAFDSYERFEGRSNFKTWLMGIAKNKSHDWLRRTKREPAVSDLDSQPIIEQLIDPQWSVHDHVAAKQIRAIVRLCLRRLPLAQREATYLVFFEEMSVEQTAVEVNCPPGTVKSRLFNARLRLAACLRRQLGHDGVAS